MKEVVAFVYAPSCFCSRIAWFNVDTSNQPDFDLLEKHARQDVIFNVAGKSRKVQNYLEREWMHNDTTGIGMPVDTGWAETVNKYICWAESEDERYHSVRGSFDYTKDYCESRSITALDKEPCRVVRSFYIVDTLQPVTVMVWKQRHERHSWVNTLSTSPP